MSDYGSDFEDATPRQTAASSAPAPTPQQDAILKELRSQNANLRRQLSTVNSQLDEQLSRKGLKSGYRPPAAAAPQKKHTTILDQRRNHNDKLRKRNQEVEVQLEGRDLQRLRDLRNLCGEISRTAEDLKDENRSLENVYANQRQKLAAVEKVEEEMAAAKAENDAEIRETREQIRRAKELRDADASEMKGLRVKLSRMEQKVKVQDTVGSTVRSVGELQEQVEEKDKTIEALKYQVAVLSKTNVTDKKRAKARSAKISQQIADLREEVELLQDKLKAKGLAAELGVDSH